MANMTFVTALPTNVWTEIVDGAAYSSFGVQLASNAGVMICIAESLPAASEEGFIVLTEDGTTELSTPLPTDQKVYGRGQSRAASVRGYRVAVA